MKTDPKRTIQAQVHNEQSERRQPQSRYGTKRRQDANPSFAGSGPSSGQALFNAEEQPRYVISIAAQILGVHPQTLRLYEREGLVEPRRSGGKIRLYSERDLERVRSIMRLTNELGVNLAGAEAILYMRERMLRLREEMEQLRRYMEDELEMLRRELDIE
jgi:DNA-binding transcriptional MerR regulator